MMASKTIFLKDLKEEVDYSNTGWTDAQGNSLLHLEARAGQINSVISLVQEHGLDVNLLNSAQQTPLHLAAAGNDKTLVLQTINFLLDHGANPFNKDRNKDTFLHTYVEEQFMAPDLCAPAHFHSMVEYLAKRELASLFSVRGSNGITPLQLALMYLEPGEETMSLLCSKGLDVNFEDDLGDALLAFAVYGWRSRRFISYLIFLGADPKHVNEQGMGLLPITAFSGTAATLNYFIKLGLAPHNRDDPYWNHLLKLSVDPEGDQVDVLNKVKLLLAKGANWKPSCITRRQTPLHVAGTGSSLEVIKWMIDNGADPYAKDFCDYTFLHHFLWRDEPPTASEFHSLAEYLLGKGYSKLFNTPGGDDKSTAVQIALHRIEVEERTLILLNSKRASFKMFDKNLDSSITYAVTGKRSIKLLTYLTDTVQVKWKLLNRKKNSILHFAAEQSTLETLKFFLEKKGQKGKLDVNQADKDGDTPLHCAVQQEDKSEILAKCKLLVEKGADVRFTNRKGKTPMAIVRKDYEGEDKEELMKLLEVVFYADEDKEMCKKMGKVYGSLVTE